MIHKIKSWTFFYDDIATGNRKSDIRDTSDRRFKVGDYMELNRFDPVKFVYTGEIMYVRITYIQTNQSNPCAISDKALADNYAVLSIEVVDISDVSLSAQLNLVDSAPMAPTIPSLG